MKKLALLLCLSIGTSAFALETSVKPEVTELKTKSPKTGLYVGNSFTYYNCGVNGYVRGLTQKSGIKWTARMNTISGGRLSFHPVKEYLAPAAMDPYDKRSPKFDVVFLQGQSSAPVSKNGAPVYREALKKHVETIRTAGSEPVAVMTWALQDKPENTRPLAEAITKEANKLGIAVLPVGLAFAESLKERPDLILHSPDKRHPSAAGSYLYGAMVYSLLFKKSPEGIDFQGGCEKPLKKEDALFLQRIAWKTTKEFFGWK